MSFDYKRLIKYELNISEQEKKYRVMGGAGLLLVSVFTAKILLLLVGLVLVATGYVGWCPAYSSMDKSTRDVDNTATPSH